MKISVEPADNDVVDFEAELNPVSRAVLQHVDRYGRRSLIAAVVVASMVIVLTGCVWGMWIAGTPRYHWPAAIVTAMIITFICSLMVATPIVDISAALGDALEEMERRASTDALTGALLRDAFADRAAEAGGRAHRAVAMVDVDRFKRVNDEHGHAFGDDVLVAIVGRLHAQLPDAVVGRLGGDEFAVAAGADPAELDDRLSAALTGIDAGRGLSISCSVGTTEWTTGETIDAALSRADGRLLEHKATRPRDPSR